MKNTRSQWQSAVKFLSEVPADISAKGMFFNFNEGANGRNVTDTMGAFANNDAVAWFPAGIATINGAGNPLVTNKGFVTFNGIDNYIKTSNAQVKAFADLNNLAVGESVIVAYAAKGALPSADEWFLDAGDQWFMLWKITPNSRVEMKIRHSGGSTATVLNEVSTPNMHDGVLHNVFVCISKINATQLYCNRWVDGNAGSGWTVSFTSITAWDDSKQFTLFSNGGSVNHLNKFGSTAQLSYFGVFKIPTTDVQSLTNLANDFNWTNPRETGELPSKMRLY